MDGLGNPLRFILTGGQVHDATQAQSLVEGFKAQTVLADKGYASSEFRRQIEEQGMLSVIPPKANQREPWKTDFVRYKERPLVECLINKIKHFRRVFSRFEKLGYRYLAFLYFVGTLIWLR